MAIKLVPDVGAPVAVVAIDLITESYAPTWNEWISYIVAAGGYAGAAFGFGGDFVKNMGIAAFPWAAKNIYSRVKGGMSRPVSRQLAFQRRVARYPAQATESEFQGVRLT